MCTLLGSFFTLCQYSLLISWRDFFCRGKGGAGPGPGFWEWGGGSWGSESGGGSGGSESEARLGCASLFLRKRSLVLADMIRSAQRPRRHRIFSINKWTRKLFFAKYAHVGVGKLNFNTLVHAPVKSFGIFLVSGEAQFQTCMIKILPSSKYYYHLTFKVSPPPTPTPACLANLVIIHVGLFKKKLNTGIRENWGGKKEETVEGLTAWWKFGNIEGKNYTEWGKKSVNLCKESDGSLGEIWNKSHETLRRKKMYAESYILGVINRLFVDVFFLREKTLIGTHIFISAKSLFVLRDVQLTSCHCT